MTARRGRLRACVQKRIRVYQVQLAMRLVAVPDARDPGQRGVTQQRAAREVVGDDHVVARERGCRFWLRQRQAGGLRQERVVPRVSLEFPRIHAREDALPALAVGVVADDADRVALGAQVAGLCCDDRFSAPPTP